MTEDVWHESTRAGRQVAHRAKITDDGLLSNHLSVWNHYHKSAATVEILHFNILLA